MLIIYSDLAYQLGLQQKDALKTLSQKFGFKSCEVVDETSIPIGKKMNDPLKLVKKTSKIQLFRLTI